MVRGRPPPAITGRHRGQEIHANAAEDQACSKGAKAPPAPTPEERRPSLAARRLLRPRSTGDGEAGPTSRSTHRSSTYISGGTGNPPGHVDGVQAPERLSWRIRGEEVRHHGRFLQAQQRVDSLKVVEGRAKRLAEPVPRLDPVEAPPRRRTAYRGGVVMTRDRPDF
jgi:hypothetical protein